MRTLAIAVLAVILLGLAAVGTGVVPARPAEAEIVATVVLGTMDNNRVRFEADYNENNRKIIKVRVTNNGTGNARLTLLTQQHEIVAQVTFPGGTTTYNVAGEAVTVDADGYVLVPYEVRMDYPVP